MDCIREAVLHDGPDRLHAIDVGFSVDRDPPDNEADDLALRLDRQTGVQTGPDRLELVDG